MIVRSAAMSTRAVFFIFGPLSGLRGNSFTAFRGEALRSAHVHGFYLTSRRNAARAAEICFTWRFLGPCRAGWRERSLLLRADSDWDFAVAVCALLALPLAMVNFDCCAASFFWGSVFSCCPLSRLRCSCSRLMFTAFSCCFFCAHCID